MLIGRNELNTQIPSVWPLHPFPNHVPVNRASRGQVGHTQPCLQFHVLWADQQATEGVDYPRKSRLEMHRSDFAVPFDDHRYARVHSRAAPIAAHFDISWQVFAKWHSD